MLLTFQQCSESGKIEVSLHILRWSITNLKRAVNSLRIGESLCPFDTGQSVRKKTNSVVIPTEAVMRTTDSDHARQVNGIFQLIGNGSILGYRLRTTIQYAKVGVGRMQKLRA